METTKILVDEHKRKTFGAIARDKHNRSQQHIDIHTPKLLGYNLEEGRDSIAVIVDTTDLLCSLFLLFSPPVSGPSSIHLTHLKCTNTSHPIYTT